MTKYKVSYDNIAFELYFDTIKKAEDWVLKNIKDYPERSIFNYCIDCVESSGNVSDVIPDFESACEYLHLNIGTSDCLSFAVNDSINLSTIAFYKLNIIAKAWNKFDDFEPDYTDVLQPKWQPSFTVERNKKGINELTIAEMNLTYVDFENFYGKYICFRSENIAELFSKTFVNLFHILYNECF